MRIFPQTRSVAARIQQKRTRRILRAKEETMKEILVAIDSSEGSRAAIDEAVDLAGPLGAHITFASVRKPPSSVLGTPNYECRLARDLGIARATVDTALRQARDAGVEARGEVLEGNAVDEILSFADNCHADLIVMGSRGHGALAGALLGSVSSAVAQHANVPVLVAKQSSPRQRQAA
jgi:nucleotide-binding universal stress UspA family protein